MKYLIILLLLLTNYSNAQELIQLIGIDVADSNFANYSWSSVMGDTRKNVTVRPSDGKKFLTNDVVKSKFIPYQTIGLYRKDDSVEIKSVDYLLIPTKKGFKYATLNVQETKADTNETFQQLAMRGLELQKSITKPIFFNSKEKIESFMKTSNPSLKKAIDTDFERFSFVTPVFYTTTGYNSFVHGGPTGLNSDEQLKIYPLDWDKRKISNVVSDYLSNSDKNKIILNTFRELDIDPSYGLNWVNNGMGTDIDDYKGVYFDFRFQNNGVYIIPYTFWKSNNSRGLLEKGSVIENIKLYKEFNVKKAKSDTGIIFISPDKSTKTVINQNLISVYDNSSNKLLANYKRHFNKVVMSEYAVGKYAEKWKNEFTDDLKIRAENVNPENIPEDIKVKGNLLIAKKWMDNNGENLLIVSSRGPLPEPEPGPFSDELGDEHYVELFGEQYILKDKKYVLLWDIHDFVRHCPSTLYIDLLPNSTSITDLDKDNITETTLVYKLACRSDLSPSYMKILMHENDVKMGLRGDMRFSSVDENKNITYEMNLSKIDTTRLNESDKFWVNYGRYENENDFRNKPIEFLKFARKKWKEYTIEWSEPQSHYIFGDPIVVPNGSFEEIYKPGSTIIADLGAGWTQGLGPDTPMDNGIAAYLDGTTGNLVDILGWIGADAQGWVDNKGTYDRDTNSPNRQGSVARQIKTPEGRYYFLCNGGGWGNPAGGLIVSDAPVATIQSGRTYVLSMLVNGDATQIVLELLADGVTLTPSDAVDPTLSANWQTFSRTYDAADLESLVGASLTIRLGVGRGASGSQSHFDAVSLYLR